MSDAEKTQEEKRAARRNRVVLAAMATDVKVCSCGRSYDRASFLALPHAANGGEGMGLVWRNCQAVTDGVVCNSTLVMGA